MKTTPQAGTGKTAARTPNWRCGAPAGNRNAAKPVHPLSALKARLRDIRKRARAAIRAANALS